MVLSGPKNRKKNVALIQMVILIDWVSLLSVASRDVAKGGRSVRKKEDERMIVKKIEVCDGEGESWTRDVVVVEDVKVEVVR